MTIRAHVSMAFFVSVVVAAVSPRAAGADEIHAMVTGAFNPAFEVLVARFEQQTGHKVVTVTGGSMGTAPTAIPNRLARGEDADLVILARASLDALVKGGQVVAGSEADVAKSKVGLAVRKGATVPDISTVEALTQTLRNAASVAYSDSASGTYVSGELLPRLGLVDALKGKVRVVAGTPVGEVVARGEAEVGFQQVSELLQVAGVTVVGPIPDAVQRITVYSAGITTKAKAGVAAKALVAFITSAQAADAVRKIGLEPAK